MAQIQKGTTYSTGDQVTAANLNALADAAILLPGAITDQTAKTVPLAADTILLHSAADTALRKSTLTQLFSNATGIPLTTGVTGILPAANGGTGVNNGANTITIAGNVTHAGAFARTFTATATTTLTLPTTGTLATLAGSEALSNKTITASSFSGSVAATTLSTSGDAGIGTASPTQRLQVSSSAGSTYALITNTGTGPSNLFLGAGNATTQLISRDATTGAVPISVIIGTTERANFSSTGLAVTGALSATGQVTFRDAGNTYSLNVGGVGGTQIIAFGNAAGVPRIQAFTAGFAAATGLNIQPSGGDTNIGGLLTVGAGLAVTGALTTTGDVGIGTTPGAKLDVKGLVRSSIGTGTGSGGAAYAFYQFGTSATATENWHIGTEGDGSFRFYNQGFGAGIERMRIDSSGNLLVGCTSVPSGSVAGSGFENTGASGQLKLKLSSSTTTTIGLVEFLNPNGSVGYISTSGSATAYNTSSDYRLKDNQQPLTGSGAFIDALQPKTWEWKADGSKGVGFIAHEVQAVSPGSVVGEKDAVDEDGKPIYQAMQASSSEVIANLVAELQSLRQRVAALESN